MEHWHIILISVGVQIVIGLFIAIIGFLLKRSITQIDASFDEVKDSFKEKFKEHADRIKGLDEMVHEVREELPQKFVMRDDYIRALAAFGNKLEKIHEGVSGLGERMASLERKNDPKLQGNRQ